MKTRLLMLIVNNYINLRVIRIIQYVKKLPIQIKSHVNDHLDAISSKIYIYKNMIMIELYKPADQYPRTIILTTVKGKGFIKEKHISMKMDLPWYYRSFGNTDEWKIHIMYSAYAEDSVNLKADLDLMKIPNN